MTSCVLKNIIIISKLTFKQLMFKKQSWQLFVSSHILKEKRPFTRHIENINKTPKFNQRSNLLVHWRVRPQTHLQRNREDGV